MSAPFEPLGARAQWRLVYDELLAGAEPGTVISYADVAEVLGVNPAKRATLRAPIARAAKEFLEVDKRALAAVRNVGWRVAQPGEHLSLSAGQQRKARRATGRSLSLVTNVDMSGMDPSEKATLINVQANQAYLLNEQRRLGIRQRAQGKLIAGLAVQQIATGDELAAMRERINRLENAAQPT